MPGLERVDGETNRSELTTEIRRKIIKTEMQARRRRELNAYQQRASFHWVHSPCTVSCEFVAIVRETSPAFAKHPHTNRVTRRQLAGWAI